MYNLIAGQSYFFESYSARVIREILSAPRNGRLGIPTIAANTGIAEESIAEFIEALIAEGLVCTEQFSEDEIREIKLRQGEFIKEHGISDVIKPDGKLDYSTAESAYIASLNLESCIPTVMMELTYNCSERCIHCYNAGATRNDCEVSHRNREEIGLEDYRRVIDELHERGLFRVCLTGGDPFSKPIAWDIIDYLYQKDIAVDIYTNGQSIVDKVDRLVGCHPRLIGLSIYSGIPEIHDRITRIKGSFHKTVSVAEQLSRYGVPMSFKCVVFKINVKSYHLVKELARQYGAVMQIEINLCNGVDGDTSIINHLRLPQEVLEVLMRDPDIPMYVGTELPDYGGGQKPLNAHPCKAGMESMNLTPDGNITPCCTFPMVFGNVKTQSIAEIHNGRPLQEWRRASVGDIEECGRYPKCDFCYLCAGNNYLEHGTFRKPSAASCYMAEIRYNLMLKLQRGEDPLNGLSVTARLSQFDIDEVGQFGKEIKH